LAETSPGLFYGTTSAGPGTDAAGTLFRVDSSGNLKYLHAFNGSSEGNEPYGTLLQASDGNLYGVALLGGAGQNGTIFKSDLAGNLTVLYTFPSQTDVVTPYSLIQAADGSIYGTFFSLGPVISQVYRLSKSGQPVAVYTFAEGDGPNGPVIEASDGNLYGLNSNNSIFRLTPSGQFTTIYALSGNDGYDPIGNLTQAGNGRLYGVNAFGGADNFGTLFSVSLSGSFRVEHAFTGGADGGFPLTGTARADDGAIYGTTGLEPGTVYRIDSTGQFTTEVTFGLGGNPNFPSPGVLQGSDGKLYGVQTTFGGTVYSLDVGLPAPSPLIVTFQPSSGPVGTVVEIPGDNLLGATSVTFDGVAATQFEVTSAHSVFAVVPPNATSGPIEITTPNGSATSKDSFQVTTAIR
jgi:uncharacterized repeat protein (TIGR03803 family)